MIRTLIAALFLAAPAAAEVTIQEVTSPGGIDAWLVEERSIPFVALELRFRGGASLDEPGKRGATNLMMALLEEGAGDLDARGFAQATEELAARFDFDAYDDTLTIGAEFLTENRDEAVELLRLALQEPAFNQTALDRVRGQVESIIRSDAQDADDVASNTYFDLAFGDHPYGTDLNGTLDSVAALTREDIFAAHRNALVRDQLYVGAVGDISADELGVLLDDLLGGLPASGAALAPEIDYDLAGGVTVVDFASPQSTALFGHGGIERDDPDFFAAFILNEILGGRGLESRLSQEVREKRGLTYGVSSFLVSKDRAQMYLGSVRSSNDRIGQAIDVIRDEWTRMADEGVTAEELEETKLYLTGAYPLRFDGNGTIANILAGMQMQDLGVDYIATRNDKVNAVTLEEINRVAAELLQPENLHFVVVGQPDALETTN
ncbi:MAG: pitrilysin family protein [Pseudomonadota bacterium]